MRIFRVQRPWREPPIVLQILVLLVGGLVVAQLVTLVLTLALPPAPPVQHSLADIVAVLRGRPSAARLDRSIQSGPPDVSGPGWFTSDQSRQTLAALLDARGDDVRLAFYAPLPFAGVALPPPTQDLAMHPITWRVSREPLISLAARTLPINMFLVADEGPQGGGMRGGFQGGGTPGNGFPGSAASGWGGPGGPFGNDGGSGSFPGGRSDGGRFGNRGVNRDASGDGRFAPGGGRSGQDQDRSTHQASPGDLDRQPVAPGSNGENGAGYSGAGADRGRGFGDGGVRGGFGERPVPTEGFDPNRYTLMPQPSQPLNAPVVVPDTPQVEPRSGASGAVTVAPKPTPARTGDAIPAPVLGSQHPQTAATQPTPRLPARSFKTMQPLPIAPRASALFGLAPAPFVEGDFVAAVRGADGRWTVVQTAAEAFPNAWQRRVVLWFLIAFALVTPIGLLYARHIVRPIARFTEAAEQLGRDPSAALVALDGPAEIGRAAHAFNVMQNRLRSFVDDRTAMVGAISHDLRTPLTRLRFRIEEVEDEAVREGMTSEVAEMEAMITSVLTFIRDASTPNVRERLDLGVLVEDVVQDAALVGGDVTIEARALAPVEVDALGMRRLLANLVENAVKYGDRARIHLAVDDEAAIAEIRDDGPGVPEEELERAFEPFYRASNAAKSGKDGTGLGLAVCRSIARAHGGDVRLVHSPEGFAAELRLPLAYDATRIAA